MKSSEKEKRLSTRVSYLYAILVGLQSGDLKTPVELGRTKSALSSTGIFLGFGARRESLRAQASSHP